MKYFQRAFIFLIAFAATTSTSLSQETSNKNPASDRAPITVFANLMVVDSNNAYAGDVKLEDIKIYEDDIEQKVISLTKRDLKLDLAIVVDNSGSLRTQLTRVKEGTATLVVNLADDDEAIMIRFVDSTKIEIIENWTADKAKMIAAIRDRMFIEGGQSAVVDAVYLAVEAIKTRRKTANSNRHAVVVISDFEERHSYYTRKQLLQSLQGTDIQVFAVALTSELGAGDSSFLFPGGKRKVKAEELARILGGVTGGHSYIIDKKPDEGLKASLQSLVVELRAQFVVGYTSTNPKQESVRKLRVEIADGPKGEKRRGLIRETVYVPKKD